MTKGKSLKGRHLVITGRVSLILIIINHIIMRGLWRRRGRRSIANHTSLFTGNATDSSVNLTHLICETVKTTTKVSLHLLKLCHDGLEGHTTSRRSRRSRGKGWNNKSYRISRLHSWPFWSKLGLTSPDRTSTDSTHDDEKRKERNRNGELLKDPRDSQRKDELIAGSGILIHIYDRCDVIPQFCFYDYHHTLSFLI